MSWIVKLYETYEAIKDKEIASNLSPYFHIEENCHLEITIDCDGKFISAKDLIVKKMSGKKAFYYKTKTIIPITPKSLTGRTSGAAPYPLTDKIQYVAKDYHKYGGLKKPYYSEYIKGLSQWEENHNCTHWKTKAVLRYVEKGNIVRDLVQHGILHTFIEEGKPILITKWAQQAEKGLNKPHIFQTIKDQGDAVVRWKVRRVGEADDTTWKDKGLIKSWENFALSKYKNNGICQILGKEAFLAKNHPKAIYSQANNAKLISTPSKKGYLTFQGKFIDAHQAVGISFEVSQKSHNALSWLIKQQGVTIGETSAKKRPSVVLAWAVLGSKVPRPMLSTFDILNSNNISFENKNLDKNKIDHTIDLGESFANSLKKHMQGLSSKIKCSDNIIIMVLDSPTKGRMAINYYQELNPEDYICRVSNWHKDFAWHQRFSSKVENKPKILRVISAPSIKSIMTAVYGENISDSLKKNIVSRILPCIIESHLIPKDIVNKAIRNVCNRVAYKSNKQWLWEINLGIACSLYRGYCIRKSNNTKEYKMALEENNNSRDYLFGRLLAIAERIEYIALKLNKEEKRSTAAARLMYKFADRPSSTWLVIFKALQPYIQKLRSKRVAFLNKMQNLLDDVMNKFANTDDFNRDKRLSGEFLLAYHCQRLELKKKEYEKRNINNVHNGEEE